jgi:hypothetical protein
MYAWMYECMSLGMDVCMYVCFEIGKIFCMYVVYACYSMYIWMYVCRIDVRLADR